MGTVTWVQFSNNGDRVLSISDEDCTARVWHWAPNGEARHIILHSSTGACLRRVSSRANPSAPLCPCMPSLFFCGAPCARIAFKCVCHFLLV